MTTDELKWSVEQACFNAWPSPQQLIFNGWALRCSGGPTRRANSANPLHSAAQVCEPLIDKIEAFYRGRGRPVIFRIPDMASAIDDLLSARGYRKEATTRTLFGALGDLPAVSRNIAVETMVSPDWLTARDRLSEANAESASAYRAIIGSILLPCGFASVREGGAITALAFGVLQDDLLIVESVMTDRTLRQRGMARDCICGLFGWAKAQGARAVALQVMADNDAALRLYSTVGIERLLYGYHHRIFTEE